MEPIIRSLLDTDLYKFTMLQTVLHKQPGVMAEYAFKCRNVPSGRPLAEFKEEVKRQINLLCSLKFTQDELDYLRNLRYLRPDFVDFLEDFRLKPRNIRVSSAKFNPDELEITVAGPMVQVMLFEIYVLAIVNEVYFQQFDQAVLIEEGRLRLQDKIGQLRDFGKQPQKQHGFVFFEFGTRRRYSRSWQEEVVAKLAKEVPQFFKGTSNVDLARRYKLVPIGTMAHEYLQAHQGFGYRLRDFQKMALENWVQEYRGDLGIALTDVVGMDAFLADFDLYFAKLFDGLRHDSGDPFEWGEKALAHYDKLGIDSNTKRLVFSDGLDVGKAIELYRTFGDRAQVGFGIGTNLTNDMGVPALNIVMKLVRANEQPVAKLSDSPGKTMCKDAAFLAYLAQVFGIAQTQ